MNENAQVRDLILLVADTQIEHAMKGLLSRHESLGIRRVLETCDIRVHPERDPACLRKADSFLKPFASQYRHAIVVFDREGCGMEALSRNELELKVENALHLAGWSDRAVAVVIDPELENWVWSNSSQVDRVLGWSQSLFKLRTWIKDQGFPITGGKPGRPKEAMLAALKQVKKQPSSSLFEQLAQSVSLSRCTDSAFTKLCTTLKKWFPISESPL